MKNKKYWFVAAGTGGHIFPGIAVAREIRKLKPETEILFFGTRDRLEAKIVPQAGFPLQFLSAGQWKGRGLLARLLGLFSVAWGFVQVFGLLLRGRPDALFSVGGYVSVPTALACRCLGVPVFLLEPNIRAGLANRQMSRLAQKAFCAPGSDALKRFACPVEDVGNPVREDLRAVELRTEAKRILVLGGSQGALSLCKASLKLARDLGLAARGAELTLQCGEKNLEAARNWQREFGVEACTRVVAFIDDIPRALEAADVAIARAGAMTVAELSVAGLPTVFVPFPHAADDHQRLNAKLLADAGAALLVDERDANFEANLEVAVRSLLESAQKRQALSEGFKRFARPHATQEISKQILSMTSGQS